MRRLVSPLVLVFVVGCPTSPPTSDAGGDVGVAMPSARLVYAPTSAPMDFGAVPFPDDLYLEGGRVRLGAIPGEATAETQLFTTIRTTLGELDGFGVTTPGFFRVDGALDPASLPTSPSASLGADASVFLIELDDTGAPLRRHPIDARFVARTSTLVLRPQNGHPLLPEHTYAYVVTDRVRAAAGDPLGAAEAFAQVRDAGRSPDDPVLARAYAEVHELVRALTSLGSPRSIVGLARFTVQSIDTDLADVRSQIRARTVPTMTIERVVPSGPELDALLGMPTSAGPGSDREGGVAHDGIGWVIDGHFPALDFQSETPFAHSTWEHASDGHVRARGTSEVWFTLVLPQGDRSSVPTVVFQHGLGGERGSVFAVANTLAAAGFAVMAIDAPYHGMRTPPPVADAVHAYGSTPGPDLYGDATGAGIYLEYLGVLVSRPYPSFHPSYPRDSIRQSVADLISVTDLLQRGDFSAITTATGGPRRVDLDATSLAFIGVSLGGILGSEFVAMEPSIDAAVLNVTGGQLTRVVDYSPSFRGDFFALLLPRLGIEVEALDAAGEDVSLTPPVALYQMALDRGDSIAYAPRLAMQPTHVLFQMALDDETVPNLATEGLARASGATISGADARTTDLMRVTLPTAGSLDLGGMRYVRTLTVFDPASHGLIVSSRGSATVEHPPTPPFRPLPAARTFANPIAQAQAQILAFFQSWRAGTPAIER